MRDSRGGGREGEGGDEGGGEGGRGVYAEIKRVNKKLGGGGICMEGFL